MQWAVFKMKDVQELVRRIQGQTAIVEIMIQTIQVHVSVSVKEKITAADRNVEASSNALRPYTRIRTGPFCTVSFEYSMTMRCEGWKLAQLAKPGTFKSQDSKFLAASSLQSIEE